MFANKFINELKTTYFLQINPISNRMKLIDLESSYKFRPFFETGSISVAANSPKPYNISLKQGLHYEVTFFNDNPLFFTHPLCRLEIIGYVKKESHKLQTEIIELAYAYEKSWKRIILGSLFANKKLKFDKMMLHVKIECHHFAGNITGGEWLANCHLIIEEETNSAQCYGHSYEKKKYTY